MYLRHQSYVLNNHKLLLSKKNIFSLFQQTLFVFIIEFFFPPISLYLEFPVQRHKKILP